MVKFYPNIFKEIKIGNRIAKNRIALSPMGDNMANADGSLSEQYIAYYAARAKGGAGIIIPGVVSVDYPRGKTITNQSRLDEVKYVKNWARLAREVHRYDALLLPQLHHAGASTDVQTCEGMVPYRVSDPDPNGSAAQLPGSHMDENFDASASQFKTLSIEEIKMLEQKFITSAIFAQMADCDGVELHGISYLICQFFTKGVNFRTDEYGGSLDNRLRFAVNIMKGIRKACGSDFILGIRMPVHKWDTDGFTDEESCYIAKAFEDAGCDFIDASGGIPPTITALLETQRYDQGDRVVLAEKIKKAVSVPVFVAGALREPEFVDKVIAEGKTDCVKLGRALLADPEWPNKAKEGRAHEIRRCISCLHSCYGNLAKNQSIQCALNPTVGYESWLRNEPPASCKRRVVVVGGGIAGMQAAISASERGHNVVLLEATDKLGGQLHLAHVPPYKQYIPWAIEWFSEEIKRKSIAVELNCNASAAKISSYKPDIVILATGSLPWVPSISGIETGVESWDILKGTVPIPKNKDIAIIGGGIVGCETSLFLARHGNRVTIVEMLDNYAKGLEMANKIDLNQDFAEMGVTVLTGAKVVSVSDNIITYEQGGQTKTLNTQYLVLSVGQRSYGIELKKELEDMGVKTVAVGDAYKPANIFNATTSAYMAALNL